MPPEANTDALFAALRACPLFTALEDSKLKDAASRFKFSYAPRGTPICREGEEGHSLYIIISGSVNIVAKGHAGKKIVLAALGKGEFFGEFALLFGGKRRFSVISASDTTICEMMVEVYNELTREFPPLEKVVLAFYKRRVLSNLLFRSGLFSGLPPDLAKKVIARGKLGTCAAGSVIIREGEPGGTLYIVTDGEVDVVTTVRDRKLHIATLRAGDFFGEISVLTGTACTADVVANANTVVMKFPKSELAKIIGEIPQIKERLSRARETRLHDTMNKIANTILNE